MPEPYFQKFEMRRPPHFAPMHKHRERAWHCAAGLTVGLGVWYLCWRWTHSLNAESLAFSVAVAIAETLAFIGSLLFFHDVWREEDTPRKPPPTCRSDAALPEDGAIRIDVFIATFDENEDVVAPSLEAAKALHVPHGTQLSTFVLDDGRRQWVADMADRAGVGYLTRADNRGYKAGNLRNALFRTGGDFVVICDADTRLSQEFLANTLGYFRDPKVAWVQTPHWFYDLPEGRDLRSLLHRKLGVLGRALSRPAKWITGSDRVGTDPFLSDPSLFFDVIQRRRNRNGASFCCGAGSIFRKEALFQGALDHQRSEIARQARKLGRQGLFGTLLRILVRRSNDNKLQLPLSAFETQPFRFHVSEDILTSIRLHSDARSGWRSVYHPQVESRMLSPWSIEAMSIQRLKYAGGTFDIMLRSNPLFRRGMPWRTKLHYAATFWSYLSVFWTPILVFAPVVALVTGISPVDAYAIDYFAHLIPLLIANEVALAIGCKGYSLHRGRILALALLPINLRAVISVLRGVRPQFPPTPKTPVVSQSLHRVLPNLVALAVMALAATIGLLSLALDWSGHERGLVIANLFWLACSAMGVGSLVVAALWRPETPFDPEATPIGIITSSADAANRKEAP